MDFSTAQRHKLHFLKKSDRTTGSPDDSLSEKSTENSKYSKKSHFQVFLVWIVVDQYRLHTPLPFPAYASPDTSIWAKRICAEGPLKFQESHCFSYFLCSQEGRVRGTASLRSKQLYTSQLCKAESGTQLLLMLELSFSESKWDPLTQRADSGFIGFI